MARPEGVLQFGEAPYCCEMSSKNCGVSSDHTVNWRRKSFAALVARLAADQEIGLGQAESIPVSCVSRAFKRHTACAMYSLKIGEELRSQVSRADLDPPAHFDFEGA